MSWGSKIDLALKLNVVDTNEIDSVLNEIENVKLLVPLIEGTEITTKKQYRPSSGRFYTSYKINIDQHDDLLFCPCGCKADESGRIVSFDNDSSCKVCKGNGINIYAFFED